MSAKDAPLYGAPRPKKTTVNKPNHATSSFGAAMSAMLANKKHDEKPKTSSKPKNKDDIFRSSNKGAQKRAAADMLGLKPANGAASSALDEETWRRTKRKMDEKARIYGALKRGDIEDEAEKYGVDFDKKWADQQDQGYSDQSDDDDNGDSEDEAHKAYMQEEVKFVDEFGRHRTMSRADYIKRERDEKRADRAAAALNAAGARPEAPNSIIYGDAIQHTAFNPDTNIEQQMAELVAKRDREATPPPEKHYDASEEIRTRGTGFYQFSRDEDERKREMEELEARRRETEAARGSNMDAKEAILKKREAEAEKRRQMIRDKKSKIQAERFPESTNAPIAFAKAEEGGET